MGELQKGVLNDEMIKVCVFWGDVTFLVLKTSVHLPKFRENDVWLTHWNKFNGSKSLGVKGRAICQDYGEKTS